VIQVGSSKAPAGSVRTPGTASSVKPRFEPVATDLAARHLDLIGVEHDLGAECRSRSALGSPVAVKRTAPHMQPPECSIT
jgi:hypothetical protein